MFLRWGCLFVCCCCCWQEGVEYLFLSGSVKDVQQGHGLVNDHLLAVAVLNGGVVLGDEVGLDELDCKRRLANT